ncbi:kinase-like domain-containing protein [Gigaspora rosea]|uniref:Kinase-like domain-containing protein n=1 Tax=Gigaspora rosea TaxID=44941 RepID=A0A397VN68_9GLOM|nr:kinase-like domain-containing protein [Gigaspora rosea]
MKWEKKLELLSCIASDLRLIHSYNIIHCDLHSDNIFQNDIHNAYIGDLGFASSVNKTLSKKSGIYGTLPYVAPEVLRGSSFTKASDIYSFGMIMWEISSGTIIFFEYEYDNSKLAMEICAGLRPTILEGTAPCYAELLKRCWVEDPEKRPLASEIYETIINWKNNTEILYEFLKSDENIVIEDNFNVNNNIIYNSAYINYIT